MWSPTAFSSSSWRTVSDIFFFHAVLIFFIHCGCTVSCSYVLLVPCQRLHAVSQLLLFSSVILNSTADLKEWPNMLNVIFKIIWNFSAYILYLFMVCHKNINKAKQNSVIVFCISLPYNLTTSNSVTWLYSVEPRYFYWDCSQQNLVSQRNHKAWPRNIQPAADLHPYTFWWTLFIIVTVVLFRNDGDTSVYLFYQTHLLFLFTRNT